MYRFIGLWLNIEVSWKGYLVPARDGSEPLPDWESSWDVVAAAVTWKFRLAFRPGNYIWSFQTGFWLIWELSKFWDRGSTQNFEPDWSSRVIWPGEPFWKKCLFRKSFPKEHVHLFGRTRNFKVLTKEQHVQMTISTISTYPKFKFSKHPKIY